MRVYNEIKDKKSISQEKSSFGFVKQKYNRQNGLSTLSVNVK